MSFGTNSRRLFLAALTLLVFPAWVGAQETIRPDLTGIPGEEGWSLMNRSATASEENGTTVVTFDGRLGDGAAWLDGVDFHDGTIELRIRGKDVRGRSFVGVAFRGVDDETYDAIYFRPFNWMADNELNRSHGVQYISHPVNTWSKLREEHTGEYEAPVPDPPDPAQFFKARIEIAKPVIRVYVNDATEPCLVVDELTDRVGGRVGLWMGNTSDGSFADLVLKPSGG
jgi:hypothetical protein